MSRIFATILLLSALIVGLIPIARAVPMEQVQQWPFASVFSLPIEAQRGITVGTVTNNPNPTNMLDVNGSMSVGVIGTAAPLLGIYTGTATWNPASIGAPLGTTAAATLTVPNAIVGDHASASFPVLVGGTPTAGGVVVSGWINAAGTCTVTITNFTTGAIDLDSGTARCTVYRY